MPTTKLYLHNIDLSQNQLINGVLHNSATAPLDPVDGQLYYNTTTKLVYSYDSSIPAWKTVGSGDMTKAVYDTDNDGIVDDAEKVTIIARNSTGSTIYKGTIVYLQGSTGNRPNMLKAQANAESTSSGTFGVVIADINDNTDGKVAALGTLHDLDTRSNATHPFTEDTLLDGDTLWLSPTIAGYVTKTKPTAPNHAVFIGIVARTTPSQGRIVYRIQNGYELYELHDVSLPTYVDKGVLYRDVATNLWKTDTLANLLGYTPVSGNIYTIDGTLTADRTILSAGFKLNFSNSGIGQSTSGGINLVNSTISTGEINQYSPPIVMSGNGWNFSGSTPVSIRQYLKILSGAPPSPVWSLESSVNNGAYTPILRSFGNSTVNSLAIGTASEIPDGTLASSAKSTLFVAGDIRTHGGYMYNLGLISSANGSYVQAYTNGGASPTQSIYFGYFYTEFKTNIASTPGVNSYGGKVAITGVISVLGPGSGTLSHSAFEVSPTINNTGGTSTIRGIYYNPILTSLSGTKHIAFQNETGLNSFNNTSGNTVIGGNADLGYKLDVQGTFRSSDYAYINYNGSDGLYIDKQTIFRNYYGNYFGRIQFTGMITPTENSVGVRISGWESTIDSLNVVRDQAAGRNLVYIGSDTLNVNRSASFIVDSTTRGVLLPRMTSTQRQQIGGRPTSIGSVVGGSGYPDGTYTNVQAQGGNGFNMALNVTISGGSVTSVSYYTAGDGYRVGDVISFYYLSALAQSGGVGFSFSVGAVTIPIGLLVYQTDSTEGLYQYTSTGWSAVSTTGYLTINNPTYTGVLKSGTLTYTPSNALATLQTDVVGYNQFVIQNSDNGTYSSSDFVVSNDLSDDSTYYGDFGINSSQFSGNGSFALANAIYLYGSDGDLVLGTVTENDVHIVTNSSDVDSITALTTGQIMFPHYIANTSFTGTAAGIIGFTAAGALITIDSSTIGSGTVTSVELAAGAGISLSGTNPITSSGIITVTNSAPDQVVTITQSGGGLTIEGTYPSFNLINSDKGSSQNIFKNIAVNAQTTITAGSNNETLTVTAGTGVTVGTNNTTKTLTITNSSPDQTVSLTAGTATTISGTYPNFTIGASYIPVNKAGDTMLGYLTLSGDPANPLHAVTKQYVDSANSTSIHVHDPVKVQTTANLTATYAQGGTTHTVTAIATNDTLTIGAHSLVANDVIVFNSTANGLTVGVPYFVYDAPSGTSIRISELYAGAVKTNLTNGTGLSITSRANSGIGATLTNAGTQVALVVDGVTLIVGDRVLVNSQSSSFQNGAYVVTNIGSGSTNWILTRSTDSNKYGISTPNTTNEGDYHFVQQGVTNSGKSYVLTTEGVIVFGTTAITFTQFTGSVSYTGGTNIDINGQTISLTGQVGVANGGTGASTLTGVLIGNGTSAVTGIAGTASQILRRNSGNSAYEFFTPTYNSRTVIIVSANTTASAASNTDYVYLASGVTTITLPTAVGNTGKYTVKNTGTNTVTINTTSSQTIDGSTSVTIAVRYTALDFISDGSNWNII